MKHDLKQLTCLLSFILASGIDATAIESLGLDGRIKHLIVLMMENHSFDNMLGWMKKQNSNIDGLTGDECNYVDPQDTTSQKYCVTDQGALVDPDPSHSLDGTGWEIYGTQTVAAADEHDTSKVTMGGFIATEANIKGEPDWAPQIMDCISTDHAPILSTLASEFALFDRFYAGIPGPTLPNRLFGMSASSNGFTTNDHTEIIKGWPQDSMYTSLDEIGADYRLYFTDVPTPMLFRSMRRRDKIAKARMIERFQGDLAAGDLPEFTWIDPSYFEIDDITQKATDQHPSHDVSEGEALIKMVYEAVRNSPIWNETALVITYDEHGGFYDHVPPPVTGVPNPDGVPCVECPGGPMESFNFTRLGIRVPTVVVSPWVEKGTLIHEPSAADQPQDTSRYELSSIPATVKKVFNIDHFLNNRDAWAAPFDHVWDNNTLSEPRTDCLTTLPDVYKTDSSKKLSYGVSLDDLKKKGPAPVSDLHLELLMLLEGMLLENAPASERDAFLKEAKEQAVNGNKGFVADKYMTILKEAGALASENAAGLYMKAKVQELYKSLELNL